MKRLIVTMLSIVTLGLSGALPGAAFLTTLASAQGSGSTAVLAAQQTQNVTIQNFAFSPASLTVAQGTTVTWTNKDSTAHTVTSDSGGTLGSSQLMNGQTYSHTFDQAGTFSYHCSIHPQMKASIIVTSSSSSGQSQGGSGSTGGTSQQPSSGGTSGTQSQQQPSQMGGMGAGEQQQQQGSAPSQSPSGAVATGPVAAGSGSAALASQRTQERAAILGITAFVFAAGLFVVRRFLLSR